MRVSLHTIPQLFIDGCVIVAAGGRKTRANKARNGLHRVIVVYDTYKDRLRQARYLRGQG